MEDLKFRIATERLNFRIGVLKLPFYVGGSFLENQTRNREMQPSWKFQPREVSFRIGGTLNGGGGVSQQNHTNSSMWLTMLMR